MTLPLIPDRVECLVLAGYHKERNDAEIRARNTFRAIGRHESADAREAIAQYHGARAKEWDAQISQAPDSCISKT